MLYDTIQSPNTTLNFFCIKKNLTFQKASKGIIKSRIQTGGSIILLHGELNHLAFMPINLFMGNFSYGCMKITEENQVDLLSGSRLSEASPMLFGLNVLAKNRP